jgi:predicted phosphodiesterase
LLTFVHLSDLHIGQDGASGIDRDGDPREELIEDCKRVRTELEGDLSGVLISGDVANSGDPEQYERAREWLARLCDALGTAEENVWTVPGNHDFNQGARTELWRIACAQLRNCDEKEIDAHLRGYLDSVDGDVLLEPLLPYHEFAIRFGCAPEGPIQTWEEDFELGEGLHLRVVGLNTAILADGDEDATGNGLVLGENAMQLRRGGEDTFVLAMWHHPLNWLRDGELARSYLNARACVHVFGHEHSHCLNCEGATLSVSAGALHPRRGTHGWEPRYNFIQLSSRGSSLADGLDVTVVPRIWDEEKTTFSGEGGGPAVQSNEFHVGIEIALEEKENEVPRQPEPEEELTAVNADSESYELLSVSSQGMVASRRRRLAHKYATLPFVRRIVIAGQLGLLDEADRDVIGFEQTRLVLERAARDGRLGELWEAVAAEQQDDEMRTNPYSEVTR